MRRLWIIVAFVFAGCVTAPVPELVQPPATPGPPAAPPHELPLEPADPVLVEPSKTDHDDTDPGTAFVPLPLAPLPAIPGDLAAKRAIARLMESMSVEAKVGQLFMPAIINDSSGRPIRAVNDEVRRMIAEIQPGGIILFGANLVDVSQTRALVDALQQASSLPLLVSIDQEGGLVSRLTDSAAMNATPVPSARRVGRTADTELAYEIARVIGRELRSIGVTMNFAPVADIATNPRNQVIGSRAYGNDAENVAVMVAATVAGLQIEGISSVVKHFPGHGDTLEDSHFEMAVLPHGIERLRAVEFVPFRAGITAGADGVMLGHISLPGIRDNLEPATFAADLVTQYLRGELGFEGVVVTDSLAMGALVKYYAEDQLALRAFQAGADILLRPRLVRASYRTMVAAAADGTIDLDALNASVRRILWLKYRRGLFLLTNDEQGELLVAADRFWPEDSLVGAPEHRATVERVP